MGQRKGQTGNPAGRKKGVPNLITKDVRAILAKCIDDIAPQVKEKMDAIEDPKDWVAAFAKIVEFVIPKAPPIDPMTQADELKTLLSMAAKEAAENV